MSGTANKRIINAEIVEDEPDAFAALADCCAEYAKSRGVEIRIKRYVNAVEFLEKHSAADVVFMDIKLPGLNGMDAARRLRTTDKTVALVFVTSMRNFAVEGYEVGALDFIVKPVMYASFEPKFDRVMAHISASSSETMSIVSRQGVAVIDVGKLAYVEVMDHDLIFHTTEGDIKSYGSLSKIEQQLAGAHFVRCNNCFLVNPKHVNSIDSVRLVTVVNGTELKISYAKRIDYRNAVMKYLSNGGGGI